jgi:hypothetical protein
MVTPLTSEYAARIKDKAFARFEALTGYRPRTLKQKILSLLIYDWDWWPMFNLVLVLNQATSIDQRINEMEREGGIVFDRRHFGHAHWQWRLATLVNRIDFDKCELKPACNVGDKTVLPVEAYVGLPRITKQAGSKDSKPLEPPAPLFPSKGRIAKPNSGGSKKIEQLELI